MRDVPIFVFQSREIWSKIQMSIGEGLLSLPVICLVCVLSPCRLSVHVRGLSITFNTISISLMIILDPFPYDIMSGTSVLIPTSEGPCYLTINTISISINNAHITLQLFRENFTNTCDLHYSEAWKHSLRWLGYCRAC